MHDYDVVYRNTMYIQPKSYLLRWWSEENIYKWEIGKCKFANDGN